MPKLREPGDVRNGTDRPPIVAQFIKAYVLLQTFTHVLSGQAIPGDISNVTGNMIESSSDDPWLVRESQKRNA